MLYPRECYHKNMDTTKIAMKEYEENQNRMYEWIEKHYPHYYKLDLRKRIQIIEEYKKQK